MMMINGTATVMGMFRQAKIARMGMLRVNPADLAPSALSGGGRQETQAPWQAFDTLGAAETVEPNPEGRCPAGYYSYTGQGDWPICIKGATAPPTTTQQGTQSGGATTGRTITVAIKDPVTGGIRYTQARGDQALYAEATGRPPPEGFFDPFFRGRPRVEPPPPPMFGSPREETNWPVIIGLSAAGLAAVGLIVAIVKS